MSKLEELLQGVDVEWKRLDTIYKFQYGKGNTIPKKGGLYPVYGSNGIVGTHSEYNSEDSPVIGHIGAYAGIVNWGSGKHFVTYNGIICKLIDESVNPKFAYYFLLNQNFNSIAKSASHPFISYEALNKVLCPIPCPDNPEKSLEIQQEIVRVLDELTSLTNQLTTELETERQNRKKQFEFFREQLLSFEKGEAEWKSLGEILNRTKGTKITASQMKELDKENGSIKIFAGGKTVAFFDANDLPEKDINLKPSIIVKSRGIIEFEYYDKPFSHKNEMWSYHSTNDQIEIKYIYYFLKINELHFQNIGKRMQMPQISIPHTDKFKIPLISMEDQKRIVKLLDQFDATHTAIEEEITKEIKLRTQQYEYYREKLLSFPQN
ncbi:restriction endonuclease subunit S [Empedobacter falsenii]